MPLKEGETEMNNKDIGKVLIIPEQLVMLEEMYHNEQTKSQQFTAAAKDSHREVTDKGEAGYAIPSIDYDRHRSLEALKEISEILSNYALVDTYCQDSIEVGTRFQVLIGDGKSKETFDLILIHKRVANESTIFISCDSALGISLKGHKVGDTVSYKNGAGGLCTAEVLKIYANRLGEDVIEEEEKLR